MKVFDMILKEEKTVIDNTTIGIKRQFTYDDGMIVERYDNDYETIDNSKYEVREYYCIKDNGELCYEILRVKPSYITAYEKVKYLADCLDDEEIVNPSIPDKYRDKYIKSILEKGKSVITIVHIPNTKQVEHISNDSRFKRNKIEHINWKKISEADLSKVYEVIKDYI